jgi:hypothetical protein
MLDLETELRDLERSEKHINDGRERIRRQIALMRGLQAGTIETTLARQTLAALRSSVAAQRCHRALILQVLNEHPRLRLGMASAEGWLPA